MRQLNLIDFAALRRDHPIATIVGASVKLIRTGNDLKGCCPFHEDRTPSLTIFNRGTRFHCFGCGASGDVLDYLQRLHGVNLQEAAAMLQRGQVPIVTARSLPPKPDRDTSGEAIAIWRSAAPAAGTAAEAYLRRRGLHLPIPPSIRFALLRYGSRGDLHPCLIALLASAENKAVGIQRTFLRADGFGKADVPTPKLSLGRVRGAAIRLGPGDAELVVTGGIEDALTLRQQLGQAVWASTGEGNIASMLLPAGVRTVVIGADNDAAGEAHARRAAEAFAMQGRRTRIIRPKSGFKDFNDELQRTRLSEAR